jgi:adenylosuccinate lyase
MDRDFWAYISLATLSKKLRQVRLAPPPCRIKSIQSILKTPRVILGVANALLRHLAEKLPISRWQRDLTDSTVLRNLGPAFGHSVLAYDSALRGLAKLEVNELQLLLTLMIVGKYWQSLYKQSCVVMALRTLMSN